MYHYHRTSHLQNRLHTLPLATVWHASHAVPERHRIVMKPGRPYPGCSKLRPGTLYLLVYSYSRHNSGSCIASAIPKR